MHILIACSGTGGHIFPALVLAEVLEKRSQHKKPEMLFVCSSRPLERQIFKNSNAVTHNTISYIPKLHLPILSYKARYTVKFLEN